MKKSVVSIVSAVVLAGSIISTPASAMTIKKTNHESYDLVAYTITGSKVTFGGEKRLTLKKFGGSYWMGKHKVNFMNTNGIQKHDRFKLHIKKYSNGRVIVTAVEKR